MELMEIIKESFVFPSTDWAKLAIYIVLTLVIGILFSLGFFFAAAGSYNIPISILGILILIGAFILAFILSGYIISIIKSGIERDDAVPEFSWKADLVSGIKYVVVTIVYFIIPAIITLLVGWATNLFGLSADIVTKMAQASMIAPANTTLLVTDVIPQSQLVSLGTAITITGIVAVVLFLIFSFIQTMAGARLAKTDSLGYALNIPEAFKDIGRIGWGKVIATIVLIFIIVIVINGIISGINNVINGFSILSIIVTPYMGFFTARATGLLYSDIE